MIVPSSGGSSPTPLIISTIIERASVIPQVQSDNTIKIVNANNYSIAVRLFRIEY